MKILHIVSDTNIAGCGVYIMTYLQAKSADISAKVVVPTGSMLKPEIEKLGIEVIEAMGIADKSFSREGIKDLRRIIKSESPDVVHTHGCLSARIAARREKVPRIVYTRHSAFEPPKKFSNFLSRMLNKWMNKWLKNDIISVSNAAKQNLLAIGVPENIIEVQYNGMPQPRKITKSEQKEFLEKYDLDGEKPIISIVARVDIVKGQQYFIDVAKMFLENEKLKDAQFVIAGTGPDLERLKAYAESENASNVKFLGFVTDTAILQSITTIQTNFSIGTETSNLALLEGMSYGVPSVASDFGGNPEIVIDGDNGLICPQKDANAFYNKIAGLLENKKLYEKISENAKKAYAERFTAEKFANNIERIYKEGVV